MSDKYKTKDTEKAYFVTLTVVGWIDLFTRKELKAIVVESLKYCQIIYISSARNYADLKGLLDIVMETRVLHR